MNAHWQLWVNSLELILLTNVLIIFKTVPELVSSCVSSHLKCFSCSDNDNYNMNQSSVDHQVSPLIALLLLFVASLINIESKMSMFSVGCVCVCVCAFVLVSTVIQNQQDGFPLNLLGGWGMDRGGNHYNLGHIQVGEGEPRGLGRGSIFALLSAITCLLYTG